MLTEGPRPVFRETYGKPRQPGMGGGGRERGNRSRGTRPKTCSRVAALVAIAGLAAACATPPESADLPDPADPPTVPARAAPATVTASDWATAETVPLFIEEFGFDPDRLELQAGRLYHLRLVNRGQIEHVFSSPDFFRAIALRSAPAGVVASGSPVATMVDVPPGDERVLSFVAIDPGEYAVECGRFLHEVFGMNARITIR